MSLKPINALSIGRAEQAFREAFLRLKNRKPDRLPKGAEVSQNNVAKEAGCVPSALRKSRFPSLIAEIQLWVREQAKTASKSGRQTVLEQRNRNRSLKEKIEALTAERDHALSLLVEADAKILELSLENASLQGDLFDTNVAPLHSSHRKVTKDGADNTR